jgi:hypothetical protein
MFWFWFGTWDPEKRKGTNSVYKPLYDLYEKDGKILGRDGFSFDSGNSGFYTLSVSEGLQGRSESYRKAVSHMLKHTGSELVRKDYGINNGWGLEWIVPSRYGALMSAELTDSVFNKLFIRHSPSPGYFRYVEAKTPSCQLWEVRGDNHTKKAGH